MPSRTLQTAAAVVILAISVPVLSFAVFTSILALFLTTIRASFISLPFWISVLIESSKASEEEDEVPLKKRPTLITTNTIEFRPPMSRSRTSSFVDSASLKRSSYRSDSHVSLVGTPVNRDFEGIGGWRTSQDDDDNSLWLNMKSRLDRGRSSSRVNRRAVTPGSLSATALNSPETFPMPMRTPRTRPGTSGSASPQSYFNIQLPTSKSMVSLQNSKRFSGISVDSGSQDMDRQNADQIGIAI